MRIMLITLLALAMCGLPSCTIPNAGEVPKAHANAHADALRAGVVFQQQTTFWQ